MIIFGTKGVNLTKGRGEFYCPECNKAEQYKLVNVRRFFTLYFIPVIPLDLLGTYVECAQCHGTFKDSILNYDPEKEREKLASFHAEYMDAIKNVMLLIMMADGVIEDKEVIQVQETYEKLTGKRLERDHIKRMGQEISKYGTLEAYLGKVTPLLNLEGKILILRAALSIASADGTFQKEEKTLIDRLVKKLELPKAKTNEVIGEYFR